MTTDRIYNNLRYILCRKKQNFSTHEGKVLELGEMTRW